MKRIRFLVLLGSLLLVTQDGFATSKEAWLTFDSKQAALHGQLGEQEAIQVESSHWKVSAGQFTPCGAERKCSFESSNRSPMFLAVNKRTGKRSTLDPAWRMGRVNNAVLLDGDRILFIGPIVDAVAAIVIMNLKNGVEEVYFRAYAPIVSPDRRFLAYTKFYPLLFPTANQGSDVLVIYDLAKSPAENRIAPGSEEYGRPVYPEYNLKNETFDTGVWSKNRMHSFSFDGGQGWLETRMFRFTDCLTSWCFTVDLDLSNGPKGVRVERNRQHPMETSLPKKPYNPPNWRWTGKGMSRVKEQVTR